MKIGNRFFDTKNHTYIMGILNVTPDSFSDGGRWNHMDDALFHAQRMIEEGADILDIGGESTRPGYTRISDEEEISRVAPVIEALKKRFDIPLSVDTYKSGVASAAIAAGADLINDIWGLKYDPEMAPVIARYNAPWISSSSGIRRLHSSINARASFLLWFAISSSQLFRISALYPLKNLSISIHTIPLVVLFFT